MGEVNYKRTGRIVGILYIIGTVSGVLSASFLGMRNSADYLMEIGNNPVPMQLGAVLVMMMGFSLALIPAFMFPILKKHSAPSAVGYVIFRGALETCTYIIRAICYLALASLGVAHVADGMQNVDSLGTLLNNVGSLPITVFVFGIGALIFYIALYKYRLIPRWISIVGLVAILLHIASGVLVLLGLQEDFDTASIIMNMPIALQEMVMAVYLIVKGFRVVDER